VRLSLEILFAGASVVDTSGGRVDTPQRPGVFGPTGVQEQGARTRGWLGNLGDPVVSVVDCRLESRHPNLLVDPQLPSRAGGDEKRTQRWYRQTKAMKCGEMSGRESQRLIVANKRGNGPSQTPWSEGGAALWTGGRKHAEGIEPPSVNREADGSCEGQRIHDVTNRMP